MNFPEIKTERLLLRKLKNSDWKMISYLRSDKEINKFVNRTSAETKEKALEFISKINAGTHWGNSFYWVITEKEKDQMMGSICLWNFSKDRKMAEIGYDLGLKHQGKGVMSESLKSILKFGFKDLNLDVIEAFTHKDNVSSRKLLEKNGFILDADKTDKTDRNNVIYTIKNAGNIL